MISIGDSHYILAAVQAWDYLDALQMFLTSHRHQTHMSCFQLKEYWSACSPICIAEPCSSSLLYPWGMYLERKVQFPPMEVSCKFGRVSNNDNS